MQPSELLTHRFVMPSIPRTMALALNELQQSDPDLRRIDELISGDPGLTCRLMQAANADTFQLSGQLHSVSESLAVLRLTDVHRMVSAAVSSSSFKSFPGVLLPQFWSYSLDTAKVARALAGLLHINQQAAFTVGLIHALGELVMRMALPGITALDETVPIFDLKRVRTEIQSVGFCYTQVSAVMAREWHFPQNMVDALEFQHKPFDNDAYEPLAGVAHLAIWRARTRQVKWSQRALAGSFPSQVADVLGLDIDMVLQQDPIDWSAQSTIR